MRYYPATAGFGAHSEYKIGLGDLGLMAREKNGIWAAMDGDRIVVIHGPPGMVLGREYTLCIQGDPSVDMQRTARHLYAGFGFVMTDEAPGTSWGKEEEQHFIRNRNC